MDRLERFGAFLIQKVQTVDRLEHLSSRNYPGRGRRTGIQARRCGIHAHDDSREPVFFSRERDLYIKMGLNQWFCVQMEGGNGRNGLFPNYLYRNPRVDCKWMYRSK